MNWHPLLFPIILIGKSGSIYHLVKKEPGYEMKDDMNVSKSNPEIVFEVKRQGEELGDLEWSWFLYAEFNDG